MKNMNAIFSQSKADSLIINSLSFFNKKFFLNLEKYGQYILVIEKQLKKQKRIKCPSFRIHKEIVYKNDSCI